MTFDTAVDTPMPAGSIRARRKQFKRALARVTSGHGRDLAAALVAARDYMARSPDQKVIVLFTEAGDVGDRVLAALRTLRNPYVWLVVVGLPGADRDKLFALGREPGVVVHRLDGAPNSARRGISHDSVTNTIVDLRHNSLPFRRR